MHFLKCSVFWFIVTLLLWVKHVTHLISLSLSAIWQWETPCSGESNQGELAPVNLDIWSWCFSYNFHTYFSWLSTWSKATVQCNYLFVLIVRSQCQFSVRLIHEIMSGVVLYLNVICTHINETQIIITLVKKLTHNF